MGGLGLAHLAEYFVAAGEGCGSGEEALDHEGGKIALRVARELGKGAQCGVDLSKGDVWAVQTKEATDRREERRTEIIVVRAARFDHRCQRLRGIVVARFVALPCLERFAGDERER